MDDQRRVLESLDRALEYVGNSRSSQSGTTGNETRVAKRDRNTNRGLVVGGRPSSASSPNGPRQQGLALCPRPLPARFKADSGIISVRDSRESLSRPPREREREREGERESSHRERSRVAAVIESGSRDQHLRRSAGRRGVQATRSRSARAPAPAHLSRVSLERAPVFVTARVSRARLPACLRNRARNERHSPLRSQPPPVRAPAPVRRRRAHLVRG